MLITIAFSVIGVLGDYFLKLASAKEQSLRTGWFYVGFVTLRVDRLRLGVRNEIPKAGYHQRSLLCLPGAAAHRDRGGTLP